MKRSDVEKPSLRVIADDEAPRVQYSLALRDEFSLSCAGDRHTALKEFASIRPPLVHLDLAGRPEPSAQGDEEAETLNEILRLDAATKVVISGRAAFLAAGKTSLDQSRYAACGSGQRATCP
jgi:hypothetical protein